MKISPPSSQSSQRDYFPLRRSIGEDFLPFSLALCGSKPSSPRDDFPLRRSIGEDFLPFSLALCGSKPSSPRDDFPLRRSTGEDFFPLSLALCGSKPSSQRSPRDCFPSQTQHRRRFLSILSGSLWLKTEFTERRFPLRRSIGEDSLPFSLCSLWLKTEFTEITERRFSSQMKHRRRFPSILSGSLWLKTEFTERRFSSQTQHTQGFPSILSGSLRLKTEFTEVTERLFSLSDAAHAGISFHSLWLSVLSVAQNRVHRGHRETIFLSDAASAKISFHSLCALCGSKPSSPRDDFLSDAANAKISFRSLWLSAAQNRVHRVHRETISSQTQHRRRFLSILSGSLCSLWLKYQSHWSSTLRRERIRPSGSQKTTLAGDCFSRCASS